MKNEQRSLHQAKLRKTQMVPPEEQGGAFWSNRIYSAFKKSVLIAQIFREVYGQSAPPEEVCPFSFVSMQDLENSAKALALRPGMNLLDLACGGGGPGLWIARERGVNLVGIDYSIEALEQAVQRALRFGIAERVKYCCASMKATGLEPGVFDGVISIDALWMAPDKAAVFREVRRLLRPQGRFVFTTWETKTSAAGELPTTEQHRTLLQEAGFRTEVYEETANWEELQRGVYKRWLQHQDELAREVGVSVAGMLINEAIWLTTKLDDETDRLSQSRRVFVVCRLD